MLKNKNILQSLKFKKSKPTMQEGKNDLVVEPDNPGSRGTDGSDFMNNMRQIDQEFEDYWQSRRRNVSVG